MHRNNIVYADLNLTIHYIIFGNETKKSLQKRH